jgi:hypothetical protein
MFGPELVVEGEPWASERPGITPPPPTVRRLARNAEWRVLLDMRGTKEVGVEVALDRRAYERLWASVGARDPAPAVDHEHEVVVSLPVVVGPSIRSLDVGTIELDVAKALVCGTYRTPRGDCYTCSDMAAGHLFVVAIRRDALPSGPVTFRVNRSLLSTNPAVLAAEEEIVPLP